MIRPLLLATTIASAIAWSAARAADEPSADPLPLFHRAQVPAEAISQYAGKGSYLPIDQREFRQLLESVQAAAQGAPRAASVSIRDARYEARLVDDDLLVGTAELQLDRRQATVSLLSLHPCTLSTSAAQWVDRDGKPAQIGTLADGSLGALVEGSTLRWQWSLRGERTAAGAVRFRFQVPRAVLGLLQLDTPDGVELSTDDGFVSKDSQDEGMDRWTVQLAGDSDLSIRIAPESMARERRRLTLLRQELSYSLATRGVTVSAQFKIDIHGEPLSRLSVDLDPSLRLVAARYGESELAWTTSNSGNGPRVTLQMPEPITGTGRVVQLVALAPLALGKPWRLPSVQVADLSWQEGIARLSLRDGLILEQLKTDGAQQSKTTAGAVGVDESLELQYYRPSASAELLLTLPREQLKAATGTLVEVGNSEITSRSTVNLSLAFGDKLMVHGRVASGWTVDEVEAIGANRVVDWRLEDLPRGTARLWARMETPITATSPARLLVRGHRSRPVGSVLDARQLQMLDFPQLQSGTRLIGVEARDGLEVRWIDPSELNVLDSPEVADLQLFAQPPTPMVFVDDASFAAATLSLVRRTPSFAVDIRMDVAVLNDELTETYWVECAPEAARLGRLLIRFSQRRESLLEWSLAGGRSGEFAARKLTPGEQSQLGVAAGGEVWEVSLQLVRAGTFELRAVRNSRFTSSTQLALASVAEAASQRGTLTVRALGETGLQIENRRLNPAPAELLESGRYQTARGAYHYQPGRDDLAESPIEIRPARAHETGAWVWNMLLDSRQAAEGASLHRATMHIQSAGRQRIGVELPRECALLTAWVDGQPYAIETTNDQKLLPIELSAGRSFITVTLDYTSPASLPALVGEQRPLLPKLDIPVLAGRWSVSLPPGFDVLESDRAPHAAHVVEPSIGWRLFGWLSRDVRGKAFNPLASRDWGHLATLNAVEQTDDKACQRFAEIIGTSMSDYFFGGEDGQLTWGDLLELCGRVEEQSGHYVVIDSPSLEWLAITPQTSLRYPLGDPPLELGIALLRSAGLVLVVDNEWIVVTSAQTAAAHARQLIPRLEGVFYEVAPGPLADELAQADDDSPYVDVAAWVIAPPRGKLPWIAKGDGDLAVEGTRGRSALALSLSPGSAPSMRVVNTTGVRAMAVAILLATLGLAGWLLARQPLRVAQLGAAAGILALFLPSSYAPLAGAVFLGCLILVAWNLVPVTPIRPIDPDRSTRRQTTPVLAQGLSSFLAILLLASMNTSPARSQDSNTPRGSAPPTSEAASAHRQADKIYQVLVPVDAAKQPVGDKFYVPTELYTQLVRRAAVAEGQPQGWMTTKALYQGVLLVDAATRQLNLSDLRLTLDFEVFSPQQELRIPFPRQAERSVAGARLNGRAIDVRWSVDDRELLLGPVSAARHRLELELRAASQVDIGSVGFDVEIPPLANARLELTLPTDAPAVEVPSATGQVEFDPRRRQLLAQLGGSDRLSVRWPMTADGVETMEVDELLWIKVRPGVTVLDAKFRYRMRQGQTRRIRLVTDPRLRPFPITAPKAPLVAIHTVPGDPQYVDLELAEDIPDEFDVDLSFLLIGARGFGNLRLPQLESSDIQPTRRLLAYSVDNALQHSDPTGNDFAPLARDAFLSVWGPSETRPQGAYTISRGESSWELSTQFSQPHIVVEQLSAVDVARGSVDLYYEALLNISHGYFFQLNLKVPPNLNVETVSLVEDDAERVAHWSRDAQGSLSVFLSSAITGKQWLSLRGRMDSRQEEELLLEPILWPGFDLKRSELRVSRQPAVLVNVPEQPEVTEIMPDEFDPPRQFGASTGWYLITDPQTTVKVQVAPNNSRTNAVAVTTLVRDANRWMAELEISGEVSDGVIDALEFEIPAQWSAPFSVDIPSSVEVTPVAGDTRRNLKVVLRQPISGRFHVMIRGRVTLSAVDRMRVPEIVPLKLESVERFVRLPLSRDQQPIGWEVFGLTPAELPANASASASAQPLSVYRHSGEHFQAILRPVEQTTALARATLVDHQVAWQADGNLRGLSRFDIEPGGSSECFLQLPAGAKLLHVTVEELPSQLSLDGPNRWRVSLVSRSLPQRIEVLFSTAVVPGSGQVRLEAPTLDGLEVEQTLWTVYGPPHLASWASSGAVEKSSRRQHELARLRNILARVQLPEESVSDNLPEMARWYRPWRERYDVARAMVEWDLSVASQANRPLEDAGEVRRLDERLADVDAWLGPAAGRQRAEPVVDLTSRLFVAACPEANPRYFSVDGRSASLNLATESGSWQRWSRWLATSAMLCVFGVGIAMPLFVRRLPVVPLWSILAVGGVFWWLFLQPSAIGFFVVLAAAWLAFRSRRRAAKRSSAS